MSNTATPQVSSGYASPAPSPSPATRIPHVSTPSKSSNQTKPKPTNVFSSDGSFLERFQHLKRDEDEKKKQEDILARKREFDNRFKARGKRPLPSAESSNNATGNPAKKTKVDEPITQYKKEVSSYAGRSLKDDGTGVRPLVK